MCIAYSATAAEYNRGSDLQLAANTSGHLICSYYDGHMYGCLSSHLHEDRKTYLS
jgi:hypothetical protein